MRLEWVALTPQEQKKALRLSRESKDLILSRVRETSSKVCMSLSRTIISTRRRKFSALAPSVVSSWPRTSMTKTFRSPLKCSTKLSSAITLTASWRKSQSCTRSTIQTSSSITRRITIRSISTWSWSTSRAPSFSRRSRSRPTRRSRKRQRQATWRVYSRPLTIVTRRMSFTVISNQTISWSPTIIRCVLSTSACLKPHVTTASWQQWLVRRTIWHLRFSKAPTVRRRTSGRLACYFTRWSADIFPSKAQMRPRSSERLRRPITTSTTWSLNQFRKNARTLSASYSSWIRRSDWVDKRHSTINGLKITMRVW